MSGAEKKIKDKACVPLNTRQTRVPKQGYQGALLVKRSISKMKKKQLYS